MFCPRAYLLPKSSSERQTTEVFAPLLPDRLSTTSSSIFGTRLLGLDSCHLCRALGAVSLRNGSDYCTVLSGANSSDSFRLPAERFPKNRMAPAATIKSLNHLTHGLRLSTSTLVLRRYVNDDRSCHQLDGF